MCVRPTHKGLWARHIATNTLGTCLISGVELATDEDAPFFPSVPHSRKGVLLPARLIADRQPKSPDSPVAQF